MRLLNIGQATRGRWRVIALVVLGLVVATPVRAADLDDRFEAITWGDARPAVLLVMGSRPTVETTADTLGVERSTLVWKSGGRTFTVFMVFDRVVSKHTCDSESKSCE